MRSELGQSGDCGGNLQRGTPCQSVFHIVNSKGEHAECNLVEDEEKLDILL